jgi:hypothetical protein
MRQSPKKTLRAIWGSIVWPVLSFCAAKIVQLLAWISHKPPEELHSVFGLPELEVLLVLIIFVVQVGLPMVGIQRNFWGAAICWSAFALLILRIVWRWRGLSAFRNGAKLLLSAAALILIALFVFGPMKRTYYATVKQSYAYLAPHAYLYDCERRAFLVKHEGASVLPDAEVVLWDNNAQRGHAERYNVIGPDSSIAPKLFWWDPSKPWDEDYTISITSGDFRVVQRLTIRSVRGKVQLASEVELNGKLVAKCRDPLLPAWYTVAANMESPSCDDSMHVPDEFITKLNPSPGNFQKARPEHRYSQYERGFSSARS